VICLDAPESFYAVAQAYENFEQVSDEEVCAILDRNP
jgi:predicted phosphoribosyltransferase